MNQPLRDDRLIRWTIALCLGFLVFCLVLVAFLADGADDDATRRSCFGSGHGHKHGRFHCVPYDPGPGVVNPAKSMVPTVKAPVPPPTTPRITVRKR